MNRLSQRKVAERAGVELDYVTRLIDVGVLAPDGDGSFTEGDVRRTRLYEGLERTGLPLEAIREALDTGELSFEWLDAPIYDSRGPGRDRVRAGRRGRAEGRVRTRPAPRRHTVTTGSI